MIVKLYQIFLFVCSLQTLYKSYIALNSANSARVSIRKCSRDKRERMAQSADQRAKHLLNVELGAEYGALDYDRIISAGYSGYTELYLTMTVNLDTCSTRAKGDVIVELAKCDLEKGTRLEEIVFECCTFAPIKEIIEEIIANASSMTTTGETIGEMMAKILQYQEDDGFNCLIQ